MLLILYKTTIQCQLIIICQLIFKKYHLKYQWIYVHISGYLYISQKIWVQISLLFLHKWYPMGKLSTSQCMLQGPISNGHCNLDCAIHSSIGPRASTQQCLNVAYSCNDILLPLLKQMVEYSRILNTE